MPALVNVADFVKIGIIAFVFIFAANYALRKTGFEQFTA